MYKNNRSYRVALTALLWLATHSAAALSQENAAAQDDGALYLYVDASLAQSSEILSLSTALADRSDQLAEIGEVTVVVADPEPRIHFRSSDALQIRQGLSTLGLRTFGDGTIHRQRKEFAEAGAAETSSLQLRQAAAEAETELLRSRLETLVLWMSDNPQAANRGTLLLLEPAIGLSTESFFQARPRTLTVNPEQIAAVAQLHGWVVAPVVPYSDPRRTVAPIGPSAVGVRVGIPWQGTDTSFDPELMLAPDLEAVQSLATSPDFVITSEAELQRVLNQVARPSNLEALPSQFLSESLALARETIVRARARTFLFGIDEGEILLEATLERVENGFGIQVAIDPEALFDASTSHSVHILAYDENETAQIQSYPWQPGAESWTSPDPVPMSAEQIVVFVGADDSSIWGMTFAAERTAEPVPIAKSASLLSIPDLPAAGLTGRRQFAVNAATEIDRIEVLLDGKKVDSDGRRPFNASINLGAAAIEHSLVVIGYDADRSEVARDGRTLNSAARFNVNIVSPHKLIAGPTDVVAEVKTPGDRALRSVDFYWQTRYLGSSHQAPHRYRVLVPLNSEENGYVRVVATLEDGRIAEDILLAGRQNFSSQVTVELMELYVVVTGKDERPVRNLGEGAFEITENDQAQEIEHFRVAGDLPLTVGLAIDSSLSLFRKLPDVQKAAKGFVRNLVSNRDRAFLVGFGNHPRLEHPPTWNLDGVIGGIDRLEPSGNTAVWEAVNLSLDQLRSVSGRRALVVFYDGDDEDLSFPYSETLEKARDSQLPIYLVVLNDEAARTQGKGFAVRSRIGRLERLAAAGGGKVFYVRTDQDLEGVFQQIGDELRSHYLLAYYPEDPSLEPEWRPVRVQVKESGLKARTVEGYVR